MLDKSDIRVYQLTKAKANKIFSNIFDELDDLRNYVGVLKLENYVNFCFEESNEIDAFLMGKIFSKLNKSNFDDSLSERVEDLKTSYSLLIHSAKN
jgi:hypothetical protein